MSLKTKRNRKKRLDNSSDNESQPPSVANTPTPTSSPPPEQIVITEHDVAISNLANAITSASRNIEELFGVSHSGKRNINKVFGYPEPEERTFNLYWQYYKYQDVANRVVDMIAKSCWRDGASVENEKEVMILDDEMKLLDRIGMFSALERADILNRIGSYSVLYVGIPDGKLPKEPLERVANLDEKQIFFSEYAEPAITISRTERDKMSPRYGLPTMYTLTPSNNPKSGGKGETDHRGSIQVHYTRIVRMAENSLGNPLFGRSSLECILNRLIDLTKVLGGSAESYFANAMQKLLMNIKPDIDGATIDSDALQAAAEKFTNNMMNFLALDNTEITTSTVAHADPGSTVDKLEEAISAGGRYPVRILFGKGPGDRAGFQDKSSYNTTVNDRQESDCAGWLEQTLEILARAGYINLPETYSIEWPPMEAMDDLTISEVQKNRADAASAMIAAIAQFEMGGLGSIVELTHLLEEIASITIETTDVPAIELEPLDSVPAEGDEDENTPEVNDE